jgi:hypothetical protein
MESQQQEQSIEQEQQHRKRKLHFSCIRRLPDDSDHQLCSRLREYCTKWGHVVSVALQPRNATSSSLLRPPSAHYQAPADVYVEMESPAAAQQVLQQRQDVLFYSKQDKKSTLQLALLAPENIGHLRSSACPGCSGRGKNRFGRPCSCNRCCK